MNDQKRTDPLRPTAGPLTRMPVSEESAGWSATLPGLDPASPFAEPALPFHTLPEMELSAFVPLMFAKTREQAVDAVDRLEREDILAVLERPHPRTTAFSTMSRGIPVLVPEESLDLASEKIAQREQDKNPFQPGPAREKSNDIGDEDDDEYEDDDPYDDDDPIGDDEDDQFDYDDEEE